MAHFPSLLRFCAYVTRESRSRQAGPAHASAQYSGTLTFLLGRLNGSRLEGMRLVGAQPYQAFASKLDEALKGRALRLD